MIQDPENYLFVADLDGTLLHPGGLFPRESARRLNRLIDRGMNFTIATARNYDSVYPLLREVNLKLPVILFNGFYLAEFHTGESLSMSNFISETLVDDLLSIASEMEMDPFVYTYGSRHRLYYRKILNPGSLKYFESLSEDNRLRYTEHFKSLDGEVAGILFIGTQSELEPLYETLSQKYSGDLNMYFQENLWMPGYYWLQIYHENSDKGKMVATLAKRLGFPLSRVVAFGDYLNDLEMFKVVGKAIAVANALPEVKKAAHQVIGSHEQDAVIEYLEALRFDP